MDIVLRPKRGGRTFYFPALPEKIRGNLSAKYQTFDIISKGSVKVPKGTNVTDISWDGEFFGKSKRNEPIVRVSHYQAPNSCVAQLKEWQESGKVLNLIVTGTWINLDVTISSFAPEIYGAYGNVRYSITLSQWKDLKIYTTSELQIAAFVKKTVPRNDGGGEAAQAQTGGSYTVQGGDTLSKIASKQMGAASKWPSIYDANASTIEAAAQSHGLKNSDKGHWIYPGTVLAIPA